MFKYLSKVLYVLSGSRIKLILLLLGFTICSVLEAVGIGLISPFINLASNPDVDSLSSLPSFLSKFANLINIDSGSELLLFLGLLIITFFCIKSVFYFATRAYIFHFSSDYKAKLASRLLKAYLTVNYEFHLNRNTANLTKNIVLETNHFYQFCILPLLTSVSNFVVICFLLVVLALTDLRLLVMILLVLLPIFTLFNLLRNKFQEWGRMASQSQKGMIRVINHAMGGIKETRVIGCELHFEKEMEHYVNQYARSATFFQSFQALPRILIETALIVFIVSFLLISQLSSTQSIQEITGILGVFAVSAMRLIPSASQLLQAIARMQKGAYALDLLYADLREIDRPKIERRLECSKIDTRRCDFAEGSENQEEAIVFRDHLELKNVTYSYSKISEPALENISLKINKGESVIANTSNKKQITTKFETLVSRGRIQDA